MNCGVFAEMFKTDPKKTSLEINKPPDDLEKRTEETVCRSSNHSPLICSAHKKVYETK
jgi:hypothetical protein